MFPAQPPAIHPAGQEPHTRDFLFVGNLTGTLYTLEPYNLGSTDNLGIEVGEGAIIDTQTGLIVRKGVLIPQQISGQDPDEDERHL
jgi:hypothetical protein